MSRAFSSLSCFFISGYSFFVWSSMARVYLLPRVQSVVFPIGKNRLDELCLSPLAFSPSCQVKQASLKSVTIPTQD